MVNNYNDLLRKQISSCFASSNDEDNTDAMDFLYNLSDEQQKDIMRLVFADYYKLSYYQENKIPDIFSAPLEDVIDYCITDVGIAIELMEASKVFNEMDYLSKCLLLDYLEEKEQDANICAIYKLHVLDKFTYKIIDDIEHYKNYYKEYLEVNNTNPNKIQIVTEYFSYRILDLKSNDFNKYQRYILEFLKVYYKWKKFIRDHEGDYLLNKKDIIYLDLINSVDIANIFEELETNFDFLFTIVGEYLHYKTQKIEIKEEIIDNYFNNSTSSEVKEKLKIKK